MPETFPKGGRRMIWIKEALKKFWVSMLGRGAEKEVTEQEVPTIEPPLTESPPDSGKLPSRKVKRQERRRLAHAGAATPARAPQKRKRKVAAEQKPKVLPQRPLPETVPFDPMELLPIENLVPEDVDSHCVKMIILWGFIRPGRVEQFFGEHYLPFKGVRRSVLAKGIRPEDFDTCFPWLMKGRVILQKKIGTTGRGELLCSLNPHPDSVNPPAREIIRIAVRASRILSKR